MTTETNPHVKLGELLVEAGVLTRARLNEALEAQRTDAQQRRLGELLVALEMVDEARLTTVLARQFSVPCVSLQHVDFSRQLLNLVPRELADAYGVIPVYVRHVRGQGDALYVASDDPTHDEAFVKISAFAGLPVRPMIAPASEIRAAIRVYYGGAPASARLRAKPISIVETPPAAATPSADPTQAALPVVHRKPTNLPATARGERFDDPPDLESRPIEIPRRGSQPSISVTLLDGTTMRFPKPRRRDTDDATTNADSKSAHEPETLTARDLISALRAVSHGAEAREILGDDPRWEAMFAALLSVLLRKRLVADWEFVEELKKM